MQSRLLWALAGLNVLLVVVFIGRITRDNTALAQSRRPGDMLAITAEAMEERNGVVFLLDTSNGHLGGLMYNSSRKVMETIPPIDLERVFQAATSNSDTTGKKSRR